MQFANWFSIPTNRVVVLIDGPPQQIGWLYNYNYFKQLEFYYHFFDWWLSHQVVPTQVLSQLARAHHGFGPEVSASLWFGGRQQPFDVPWMVLQFLAGGFRFYMVLHGFAGCSAYILYFPCGWDDPQISHSIFCRLSFSTRSAEGPGALRFGGFHLVLWQQMSWQHFGATQGWRKASEQERGSGQKVTWRRPWRAWLKAWGYQLVMWEIKELSRPTSIWPLHNNDAVNHTIKYQYEYP